MRLNEGANAEEEEEAKKVYGACSKIGVFSFRTYLVDLYREYDFKSSQQTDKTESNKGYYGYILPTV